jgi:hypothetical protein
VTDRRAFADERLAFRNAVWNSDLKYGPRLVALAYEQFAGKRGLDEVWVTEENLVRMTGMGRDACMRYRAYLVAKGVLVLVCSADRRRGRSAVYRLDAAPLVVPDQGVNTDFVADGSDQVANLDLRKSQIPTYGGSEIPTATRDLNQRLSNQMATVVSVANATTMRPRASVIDLWSDEGTAPVVTGVVLPLGSNYEVCDTPTERPASRWAPPGQTVASDETRAAAIAKMRADLAARQKPS